MNNFFIQRQRRGLLRDLQLGLEEITDAVQRVERELWFVGRVQDIGVLQKADKIEQQEEIGLFLTPKGSDTIARMRLRRTKCGDQISEDLTFKVRKTTDKFFKESTTPAPGGMWELLLTLPDAKHTRKTRYSFATGLQTGEVWQVDVYDGQESWPMWVKIDFEFIGPNNIELPPMPQGIVDVISAHTTNVEERQKLDEVMAQLYRR